MTSRMVVALAVLVSSSIFAADTVASPSKHAAAEYSDHFGALGKLSIAVAEAMPPEQYGFRPHPESMNFGELLAHIAATNYAFCAGLKDSNPPAMPSPADFDHPASLPGMKDQYVKLLRGSFEYCSSVIPSLTEEQLSTPHNSPDGRLLGREILLAMYVHVAHHRGQAEIYLRDKDIRPPMYRF